MFVVFFGSDRGGVRDGATQYIEAHLPPDGTLSTIEAIDFEVGQLADALGASSLFGGSEWFVLDTPSANPDFAEAVTEALVELAESTNTFVILEGSLLTPAKKKYEKYAQEVKEFMAEKGERFNVFTIAEALANKDKRQLWVLLQVARLEGLREEEIVGMLWWQLKSLRLAKLTNSASEAGMKDFPYNKAKQSLSKFSEVEVERLSHSLLKLYHDSHAGLCDMDSALEQWALGL